MSTSKSKPILQTRDLNVLRTLFESRLVTAAQLSVLHFDSKSEAAKKRLQKLKSAGFIRERRDRVSNPSILFITSKGIGVLRAEGVLQEYPHLSLQRLEKRARVSQQTIQHELAVVDVKSSFHQAIRGRAKLKIAEFCSWPILYEFTIAAQQFGRDIPVRPDGFIRIHEKEPDGGLSEHCFFLEVDRSTEVQDRLARVAACYQEYYHCGGFAEWCGGTRDNPKEYPFRVLMVFKTAERRNNLAERLLQAYPPILSRVWLTTFDEVKENPLANIWIRPRDYRDATKGTRFDPELERKSWAYRRQSEREMLVESKVKKLGLFDPLP